MATNRQAEIAASLAAVQDLGPGYDQALAEGLVERIGAEIDERIAAEIDNRVTAEVDSRILAQLDRYAGCRHQRRRARRMIRAERRAVRAERADRSGRQSIMLALGSMLVALLVTAIVLKGSPGVAAVMLMALIWVIVGIINVAYAVRKHPQQPGRAGNLARGGGRGQERRALTAAVQDQVRAADVGGLGRGQEQARVGYVVRGGHPAQWHGGGGRRRPRVAVVADRRFRGDQPGDHGVQPDLGRPFDGQAGL